MWQPGNVGALVHGLRSPRAQQALLPGQEGLRGVLAEQRRELLDDLGGEQAASAVTRDTVDRYLRLGVLASTLEDRIEREGMVTGKGRTRAAVTLYLSIVDRMTRLAQQLGFDRRPKVIERQSCPAADFSHLSDADLQTYIERLRERAAELREGRDASTPHS